MRTCYLTCGFVNLLRSADARSPLKELSDRKSGDERALCCSPGSRGLTPPASHPRRLSPYLDLAKRLEAYLAAGGVPLEAEDEVGNVQVRSASSISLHLAWLGFEVFATITEMPRHAPIPG